MKTTTQRDYQERILRVLVHIQTHLDHFLDLEALASLAHFSPCHFHRVFRGMVGEPVMEHVRRLRLERAAHLLKTTAGPITQIAFDSGYETHEAFTRAFRAMFEASPTEFRQLHGRVSVRSVLSGVHYTPDGTVDAFQPLQSQADGLDVRVEQLKVGRGAFMRHTGP